MVDPNTQLAELYTELRAAAARMLRRDAPALTLQPTELVTKPRCGSSDSNG